jgi:hypothetical protein
VSTDVRMLYFSSKAEPFRGKFVCTEKKHHQSLRLYRKGSVNLTDPFQGFLVPVESKAT